MDTHRPRSGEPGRGVDRHLIGERRHRPGAWYGHEAPADGIVLDDQQQDAVQLTEVLEEHRANIQHALDHGREHVVAIALEQLADPTFEPAVTNLAEGPTSAREPRRPLVGRRPDHARRASIA
jgi:hypothetical protein